MLLLEQIFRCEETLVLTGDVATPVQLRCEAWLELLRVSSLHMNATSKFKLNRFLCPG